MNLNLKVVEESYKKFKDLNDTQLIMAALAALISVSTHIPIGERLGLAGNLRERAYTLRKIK